MLDLVQIDQSPRRPAPKPAWLKARAPVGENYHRTEEPCPVAQPAYRLRVGPLPEYRRVLEPAHRDLHDAGQYLYPPLRFLRCAQGRPEPIDFDEPRRVAEAVAILELKHAVITSVNRDDDILGGARAFAMVIDEIRRQAPGLPGRGVLFRTFRARKKLSALWSRPSRRC